MRLSLAVLVALVAASPLTAEQSWELRGEFVAIKPGDPEVVVLRLADGRTIEVPVGSLTPPGQAAARRQAATGAAAATGAGGEDGAIVTVRGPFGRPVRVSVPESIKDVEADAIHCRSASEAADVYRLFLAGDRPTPAQRTAAEARLKEWGALAEKGCVRLGDRWVPQAEARAASDEATKIVDHALVLMRLGNADLAEEELRKAARIDPESGRASFIIGLSYALVAKSPAKAVEQFADVVRRSPDDPAALSNLAVLEVYARRHATVVEHFRAALEAAVDPMPIAENIAWAIKLAGDAKGNPALAKGRMPDRTVDELNALYKTLTQDRKFTPPATSAAPRFLGPDGVPCAAANLTDVAKHVEAAGPSAVAVRHALGFVIAPGRVVCAREAVADPDGTIRRDTWVALPADPGRRFAATVIVAPQGGDVAILKCQGLPVDPLPVAAATPPLLEISAANLSGGSWLTVRPTFARGKVVTPGDDVRSRGRFVHTAIVPRGPGGGPIVDHAGRVVGMVASTPRTAASGNGGGFGIPVDRLWPLIEEHVPDVEAATNEAGGGDAAAAERRAVAGTVFVSAGRGGR